MLLQKVVDPMFTPFPRFSENDIGKVDEVIEGTEEAINVYGGYIVNMDASSGNDSWIDVFIVASCRNTPSKKHRVSEQTYPT